MDEKERENKKLRLGLTFKKMMTGNAKVSSFRKFESESGIRHATIVEIVHGKKNPAWSTVAALVEGLGTTLSEFADIYDKLTESEIGIYKRQLKNKSSK